jgi:hypothetical protein
MTTPLKRGSLGFVHDKNADSLDVPTERSVTGGDGWGGGAACGVTMILAGRLIDRRAVRSKTAYV